MILTSDGGSVPTDGNTQEGENLSPTDIEANLSTEVALTVLDVLELFVHHHKVCFPLCCVDSFFFFFFVPLYFDALRSSVALGGKGSRAVITVGSNIKAYSERRWISGGLCTFKADRK